MTRWIDASPSQRFRQYTLPAARRMVESGEWDRCIADYDTQIEEARAALADAAPGTFDARARARRLASLERDRDSCIRSRNADIDTITEGRRRDQARRTKSG